MSREVDILDTPIIAGACVVNLLYRDGRTEGDPRYQGAIINNYGFPWLTPLIPVDGLTRRGCRKEMTNFPETCNALTCSNCTGNYCNQGVFPGTRLQCNVCTGATDECFNAMPDPSTRRVCDSYVISGDQCYTALDSQRQVYRGCLSNGGRGQEVCAEGGNCVSCFQAGCNSAAARSAPLLSCIKCASNDPACAWGFRANEAEMCVNQVYMGETEACLERVMWDGSVQRGCYLDIFGTCADNDDTCSICTGHGCNRLSDKSHTCYQCQSSADESCRERVEEDLEATACSGNDQRLADKGCYTLVQDDGHVVRGCLNYMDADLMAECQADGTCQVCNEDGCNVEPVEGAAGALKALSVGLLALVAVCLGMF